MDRLLHDVVEELVIIITIKWRLEEGREMRESKLFLTAIINTVGKG